MTTLAEPALELQEVRGPTAFGTTRKRFWELLWLSSVTDFRMRYVDAVLGYFWALMRPLITFGIVFLFLRQILSFGGSIVNFAPMLVIPLSTSLTAAMSLGLNLIVGFLLLLAFGLTPTWSWLILPLAAAVLVIFATALSLFLSVAFVRLPDMVQVWSVISRVLFYGTPILYTVEKIPESVRSIVMINPLSPIFVVVRKAVTNPDDLTAVQAAGGWGHLMIPIVLAISICVFSFWYFVREAAAVAESL